MVNVFENFNREFFIGFAHITWYDKEGIMELDNNRLVVFKLDDVGTRDHFNGYNVSIYSKTSGLIYSKFFRFKHHLTFTHRDTSKYYHAWLHDNKLHWYISKPTPTSIKSMVKLMMDFINKFK